MSGPAHELVAKQRAFTVDRAANLQRVRTELVDYLLTGEPVLQHQQAQLVQLQAEEPYLETVTGIIDAPHLDDEAKIELLLQAATLRTLEAPGPADMVAYYAYHIWQTTYERLSAAR